MAKATRVPVPVVKTNILLELTHEEAITLVTVCGAIGGSTSGRRGLTTDIRIALADVGIESLGSGAYTGQIDFKV